MGIADDLLSLRDEKLCKVKKLIDNASKEHAAEIADAINDITVPASLLEQVLRKYGYPISDSLILRHRKGTCRCVNKG